MMMIMPPSIPRAQGRREQPIGKGRTSNKLIAFLALLTFLMMAMNSTEAAGLTCSSDAECRRNVCIFSACAPRSLTDGKCQNNNHCFYPATESCINSKCVAKSNAGGLCEEAADCSIKDSVCPASMCLSPSGGLCSLNTHCVSPQVCINTKCSAKSLTDGDCDEASDCANDGDTCENFKCETPLVPSLMVWDGNKAPLNPAESNPSVVVDDVLFVFEGYNFNTPMKVEAYSPLTKTWKSKAGPDVISVAHIVVAVGKLVFLIGGQSGSSLLTTFFSYDTTANTWDKSWTQLPEGRANVAAAAVDDTMFIFGGVGSSGVLNTIISLDISATDKAWIPRSPSAVLPDTNFGLSATVFGTDIYLTGGITRIPANTVLKYNTLSPTTSPSTNPNSMIETRSTHMTFVDPQTNRLYAVGGTFNFQNSVEFLDLDTPSGSWESANALNGVPFFSNSGGLIGSLFHFVSRQTLQVLDISVPASVKWSPFSNTPSPVATAIQMTSPNTITTVDTGSRKVAFYNTVSNTWSSGASNFPGRSLSNPGSAVVNGAMYVMGGELRGAGLNTVFALSAEGTTWIQQDNMPLERIRGCAAVDGANIFYFGGAYDSSSDPESTLFKMDTTKDKGNGLQWTTITPDSGSFIPTAVAFCSAVIVNRKLLIFGGDTASGGSPTGLIQSYDIDTNKWDDPSSLPTITPRSRLSAVFLKGFVFVIGGSPGGGFPYSALDKVEVFDVTAKKVTAIADMPTPRYGLGSVTDGSSIFSVGGTIYNTKFPSLEKLRLP
jgi:N-acetylneuraminic acid mutarotase